MTGAICKASSKLAAIAVGVTTLALSATLAAGPAAAAAYAGGAPTPSTTGGTQYAKLPTNAKPTNAKLPTKQTKTTKPVARKFSLSPRTVTSPKRPKIVVRVDQAGAKTVQARIVLLSNTDPGSIVHVDLGRLRTGREHRIAWPADIELHPGSYTVRLHVRGRGNAVLARTASARGKTELTVRAPEPPAPTMPVPNADGYVFPVAGPYTLGDGIGTERSAWLHQGQDILAAEGVPVVAPVAASVSFVDYQAGGAGHYVVLHGADGLDYFFAHCQEKSVVVKAGQPVVAGQPLCAVGKTGSASTPHLHFEIWSGGWRVDAASAPVDPLPYLLAWSAAK